MRTLPKYLTLLRLDPREYDLVKNYVNLCNYEAFAGINDYTRINEQREMFYRWHLTELQKKFNKPRKAQMTFITLNLPEIKTMQAMFKRVDFYETYIKLTGSVPSNQETVKIQRKFYKF